MKVGEIVTLSLAIGLLRCHGITVYNTRQEAQSALTRFDAQISEAQSCINSSYERSRKNNEEYEKLRQQSEELLQDMENSVADLRNGSFCSRCNRTATEIQRQEKVPMQQHLAKVKGILKHAPEAKVLQKKAEFLHRLDALQKKMEGLTSANKELWRTATLCYVEQDKARHEYWSAQFWVRFLQENETVQITPPSPLKAERFGLKGSSRSSEYDAIRAYEHGGNVKTVGPDANLSPDDIKFLRYHPGIDFTSHNAAGAQAAMPFTAGVEGTLKSAGVGNYNTIEVALGNGNTIQYLHASHVSPDLKQKLDAGETVTVHPETILGMTGGTAPGTQLPIHLHVQAYDWEGKRLDPDIALLGRSDPLVVAYRVARNKADQPVSPFPTFAWPRDQKVFDLAEQLDVLEADFLDEYIDSPQIRRRK
jgi:hypothetical protein